LAFVASVLGILASIPFILSVSNATEPRLRMIIIALTLAVAFYLSYIWLTVAVDKLRRANAKVNALTATQVWPEVLYAERDDDTVPMLYTHNLLSGKF
jgi:hypothetical protein